MSAALGRKLLRVVSEGRTGGVASPIIFARAAAATATQAAGAGGAARRGIATTTARGLPGNPDATSDLEEAGPGPGSSSPSSRGLWGSRRGRNGEDAARRRCPASLQPPTPTHPQPLPVPAAARIALQRLSSLTLPDDLASTVARASRGRTARQVGRAAVALKSRLRAMSRTSIRGGAVSPALLRLDLAAAAADSGPAVDRDKGHSGGRQFGARRRDNLSSSRSSVLSAPGRAAALRERLEAAECEAREELIDLGADADALSDPTATASLVDRDTWRGHQAARLSRARRGFVGEGQDGGVDDFDRGERVRYTDAEAAAYAAQRLPATWAALVRVMRETRERLSGGDAVTSATGTRGCPPFVPARVLDLGSGPGAALWAAQDVWGDPSPPGSPFGGGPREATLVEPSASMVAIARDVHARRVRAWRARQRIREGGLEGGERKEGGGGGESARKGGDGDNSDVGFKSDDGAWMDEPGMSVLGRAGGRGDKRCHQADTLRQMDNLTSTRPSSPTPPQGRPGDGPSSAHLAC